MVVLCTSACSVDQYELDQDQIQIMNATVSATVPGDVCLSDEYDLNGAGTVSITNNENFLYVTVTATSGNSLTDTRLHVSQNYQDFPLVGKGNFPLDAMEFQESFSSAIHTYTFEVDLSKFEGNNIVIASNSSLIDRKGNISSYWVGDRHVKYGNWYYLNYGIKTCEIVNDCTISAGDPNTGYKLKSEADAVGEYQQVTQWYLDLLDEGVSRHGTFDPTINYIVNYYNYIGRKAGEYKTIYTVTDGDCTDSVELTIIVIPD